MKATRAEIEMIAIALYESHVRSKGITAGAGTNWSGLSAHHGERAYWRSVAKMMLQEPL